jgi:hypothetical protein
VGRAGAAGHHPHPASGRRRHLGQLPGGQRHDLPAGRRLLPVGRLAQGQDAEIRRSIPSAPSRPKSEAPAE